MIVRELMTRLGLDVDAASFAKGQLLADGIKFGLTKVVDAAIGVARSFVDVIQSTAEAGKGFEETAQATGMSTRSLQEWQKVATVSGVENETLNVSLFHLARSMQAAGKGGAEQAAAFAKLGAKATDAHGKLRATDDVMMDLAAGFERLPDGAEKTALAMEVFGRSGARLIPILNKGREGIAEIRSSAFVMTEEQIKASKELVITQQQLAAVTRNLWRGAVAPLLPAITDLLKQYLAWRKANAEITRQRIAAVIGGVVAVVRALGAAFSFATRVGSDLAGNWKALVFIATSLAVAFVALNVAAVAAAAATAAAWVAAVAPIAAVGAGIAGIILVFNSLARWADGKDSLIGEMFFKARLALQKFANDPGVGDPWFVRMLRTAAALVVDLENAVDKLFYRMKVLGDAMGGEERSTTEKLLESTPLGAAARLARAAVRTRNAPGYVPLDEREKQNPSLAYLQASGMNYTPGPVYSAGAGGGPAPQVHNTFHVTQLPGEDGEHFAQRVAAIVDEKRAAEYEAAACGVPATQ